MPLAFLSYAAADRAVVLPIAQRLRAAGASLWVDVLDIPKGTRWDDETESALTRSECIVLMLTPASVSSPNVKDEVSVALSRQLRIIPVLLSPCSIPLRLGRLQYYDFLDGTSNAFDELLSELPSTSSPVSSSIQNQDKSQTSLELGDVGVTSGDRVTPQNLFVSEPTNDDTRAHEILSNKRIRHRGFQFIVGIASALVIGAAVGGVVVYWFSSSVASRGVSSVSTQSEVPLPSKFIERAFEGRWVQSDYVYTSYVIFIDGNFVMIDKKTSNSSTLLSGSLGGNEIRFVDSDSRQSYRLVLQSDGTLGGHHISPEDYKSGKSATNVYWRKVDRAFQPPEASSR